MKTKLKLEIAAAMLCILQLSKAQWTQMASIPINGFYGATGFSIGNKAYIIAGKDNSNCYNNVWEYNSVNDSWTQKANFPGTCRNDGVSFAINGKGYYGTGNNYTNDFWEYNPLTDSWTQKAPLPGTPRTLAIAFSVGNKGYIGSGTAYTGVTFTKQKDLWEYNPTNDSWIQKNDLPLPKRTYATAVSNGNVAFFGAGLDTSFNHLSTFYEYNQVTDTWVLKTNMPAGGRVYTGSVLINNDLYITGGRNIILGQSFSTCFNYNKITNNWTTFPNFTGGNIEFHVALAIGNEIYIGTGTDFSGTLSVYRNDWWKYSLNTNSIANEELDNPALQIYPNPANESLSIRFEREIMFGEVKLYNVSGALLIHKEVSVTEETLNISSLASGFYVLEIIEKNKTIKRKKIIKE